MSECEASSYKRRKRSFGITNAASVLFPSDKCLFCNKLSEKVKGKKQFLVKCVTDKAQNSIKLAAKQKKDDKMMGIVNGIDLVVHYHNYCRQIYTQSEVRCSLSGDSEASIVLEAYKNAFDYLCSYIEEHIILHLKVERMTMPIQPNQQLFVACDKEDEIYTVCKASLANLVSHLIRKHKQCDCGYAWDAGSLSIKRCTPNNHVCKLEIQCQAPVSAKRHTLQWQSSATVAGKHYNNLKYVVVPPSIKRPPPDRMSFQMFSFISLHAGFPIVVFPIFLSFLCRSEK